MATTKELDQKISLLQSALIGLIGRDPEGEYRLKFVKRVLRKAQEPARSRFRGREAFLKELRQNA
ncbi:MAG: hypothetical protein AAB562_02420 [Patescibacteria group bacterium]